MGLPYGYLREPALGHLPPAGKTHCRHLLVSVLGQMPVLSLVHTGQSILPELQKQVPAHAGVVHHFAAIASRTALPYVFTRESKPFVASDLPNPANDSRKD